MEGLDHLGFIDQTTFCKVKCKFEKRCDQLLMNQKKTGSTQLSKLNPPLGAWIPGSLDP